MSHPHVSRRTSASGLDRMRASGPASSGAPCQRVIVAAHTSYRPLTMPEAASLATIVAARDFRDEQLANKDRKRLQDMIAATRNAPANQIVIYPGNYLTEYVFPGRIMVSTAQGR